MELNSTTASIPIHDEFPVSPIECYKLNILAVYLCFLLVGSTVVNAWLIGLFFIFKELRKPINTFVFANVFLNIVGSLVELPFVIGSNFSCRWIFGQFGCILSAYFMYAVGCIQIYMMVAISFERYYTISNPMSIKSFTFKKSLKMTGLCIFLGTMWPTMSLFGWSNYVLEGGLTSCSVDWSSANWNVFSYNICIFIFVYIIPLSIIIGTSAKLIHIVKSLPKLNGNKDQSRYKMERKITKCMVFYILIFVGAWTPYAIVVCTSMFIDPEIIGPMAATLPALIAKSSMFWSSLYFLYTNSNIRKCIKQFDTENLQTALSGTKTKPKSKETLEK